MKTRPLVLLWHLLTPSLRRRSIVLSILAVAGAALDALALLMIVPLAIALQGDPLPDIAATVLSGIGIDPSGQAAVVTLATACAGLFAIRALYSIALLWLTTGFGAAVRVELGRQLMVREASLPYLESTVRNSAEAVRTLTYTASQISTVLAAILMAVTDAATLAAILIVLLIVNPLVAAVIVVYFTTIALVWVRLSRRALGRAGVNGQAAGADQYRFLDQTITVRKELQLRGRSHAYSSRVVSSTRALASAERVSTAISGAPRFVAELALVGGVALVVAVAWVTGIADGLLPILALIFVAGFRGLPSLNRLLFTANQVRYTEAAADTMVRAITPRRIDVEDEGQAHGVDGPGGVNPAPSRGLVTMDRVSFRYPTRTMHALTDVTLAVAPGEAVGITGPTGCGKSTLLDIMLGFLEPERGSVYVDGAPLYDVRDQWQRRIGYVAQDVALIDDTIRGNVALGWDDHEIDDDMVATALDLAHLTEVVEHLPDGVNTLVGERGVRLSGGQRQRLGLARALYTNPDVLVLDEATSHLDNATEQAIMDSIAQLHGRITIIMVAHRLQTVMTCDRVIVLDAGRVVASGGPDEVLGQAATRGGPHP